MSGLEFTRRIDNHWGIVECEWTLGHIRLELGRYGDALASARDADREREVPIAPMLIELGHGRSRNDKGHAETAVSDCLAMSPEQ